MVGSYKKRRSCLYFQQSGCLLSLLEHVCDFDENRNDFAKAKGYLLTKSHLCCCPRPFEDCSQEVKDPECVKILENHLNPYMKSLFKKTTEANGVEYVNAGDVAHHKDDFTFQIALDAFLQIRRELFALDHNCGKYLSSATIPVECDNNFIPPFKRQDHQCEQVRIK